MRALCEGCGQPQPPDWRAGDLCSFCGKAVRRDVRCFWCAKWTPFAKFCRSCGAEVVEERLYGAARMLKDAGTDRFTVPKMLREFDPGQVENFLRIYQRHAVAVARHVDEVRFLERFLYQKTFSSALEDDLVPQLPWNEETLKRLSGPPLPPGDDAATVRAIAESTPFGIARELATIVRVKRDDWKALEPAYTLLGSGDEAVQVEAALAVSSWRVRAHYGRFRREEALVKELKRSPFKLAAGVRLGLIGLGDPDLLKEALASQDKDLSFSAALALGDIDRLQAAMKGEPLEQIAAGHKLIELGIIKVVEEPIQKSPIEVQRELVEALVDRKEPAPEMAQTLLEIVEKTEDKTLRERAARILCRNCAPGHALRIARAAKGEQYIFQSLLSEGAALPPETVAEVVAFMLESGRFRMSQYGMKEAGARGALPDTFVPRHFERADGKTREELLRLAEVQLEARWDEALHRFVMNVMFGPYPAETRAAAWWGLHRGYRRDDHRGEGPLALKVDSIVRFFGSVRAFLPKLTAVLRDPATLKEVGYYEKLTQLLNEADPAAVVAIVAEESAAHELVRALIEVVKGDYWAYLLDSGVKLLGQLGVHPRWRDEVIDALSRPDKKGNYHWDKALRLLRYSVHGLPDEDEWGKLPLDFVPKHYSAASPEGKGLLLRVADQQLIDHQDAALLHFLHAAALDATETSLRKEALRIREDRSRLGDAFPFRRDHIEKVFGSVPHFLSRIGAVLGDEEMLQDRNMTGFLEAVFEDASPAALDLTLAAPEPAKELVAQIAGYLATRGEQDHRQNRVPLKLLRLLGRIAQRDPWREDVMVLLRKLQGNVGSLNQEVEQILRRLAPSPQDPPPRTQRVVEPVAAPIVAENPWVAKQREAERLGRELQEACMRVMMGPGTTDEKTREAMRLQTEFQAKIKSLYGA